MQYLWQEELVLEREGDTQVMAGLGRTVRLLGEAQKCHVSWGVPTTCLARIPHGCHVLLRRPFLPEGDSEQISQSPNVCRVAKLAFLNIHTVIR